MFKHYISQSKQYISLSLTVKYLLLNMDSKISEFLKSGTMHRKFSELEIFCIRPSSPVYIFGFLFIFAFFYFSRPCSGVNLTIQQFFFLHRSKTPFSIVHFFTKSLKKFCIFQNFYSFSVFFNFLTAM